MLYFSLVQSLFERTFPKGDDLMSPYEVAAEGFRTAAVIIGSWIILAASVDQAITLKEQGRRLLAILPSTVAAIGVMGVFLPAIRLIIVIAANR